MKKLTGLSLIAIFFSFASLAQALNTAKLDSLFNMLESRGLAMGSVAISINGKLQYQRTIGYALIDHNEKIPATNGTRYRIGSISKMFTAVMIFQLIDEGRISLDQKLNVFFPELPNAKKITIGNLLSHRSGLHDYTHDTNFPEWMDKPKTHEELLKIISEKGPDFEPGTKADYCNSNYLVLSYIVEKVCKQPYGTALKERVLSRIGLKNTYYGQPIDIKKNESSSYKHADGSWKAQKETDMSIHCGAGSIVSTPADLSKFIEALFSNKLISKSSLNTMKTMIEGYGMGMFPFDYESKAGYGHDGRIEEFYSSVRYYPDKKLSFAYCTNGIIYPRVDIINALLKICFNDPYSIPFSRNMALKTEDLDKYLGKYASDDLPFAVIVKKNNDKLLLEANGKTMEAEPIAENYFMNLDTDSFFEFYPEKAELQIKETANIYYLKRDK